MATVKQIGSLLEKSFEKWDYKKAIRLSDNESKTRDYLIEPFFNLLGFNKILHSEILKITKYGILSFHTSDINKYRGRPAAFNEFINNEKFGGVTLQLLDERLDFGKIVELRKVEIETSKSYDETLFRMMNLKSDMIIKGLNRIKKGENLSKPDTKCELSTFAKSRKFNKVLSCLKKTINKRYLNK